MGKTLKTVGAIVGGAVLIATGVGALAGMNVAAMGIASFTGSLTVGQLGTIASGVAAVGGALDKPKSQGSGSPSEWTSNPDQPVPFLIGRMGVAGKIVHRDEFGPDNMYQGVIGVLSGAGPIKSVLSFKGDEQPVTFDGNGKAVSSQWANEMWMRYRLGTQPDTALTSPPGLKNGATLPSWGLSHKLSGKACYMQVLGENSKRSAYPNGEPVPQHLAEGIFGWDGRFDDTWPGGLGPCRFGVRSTYRYITDPNIAALNWALGLVENGKVVGGIGSSLDGVDVDAFLQAANVSEANGWIVAAWPDTSEDVSQVLNQLLQAGGASRARNAGRISCVTRGAVLPSVVTVTASDLAGPIELDTGATLFNRLNTITPRFMSEAHNWQPVAGTPVTFSNLVTEDGAEQSDQIDYRFVPLAKQAAELAGLDILDAREPFSGTVPLKPHMRRLKPGSRFVIDAPGLLLNGVKCLVLGRSYTTQSGEVRISFRSETDGKVALALGQTTALPAFPNLSPPNPLVVQPPLPGDWTITVRPPGTDGTQVPGFDLTGVVSNDTATAVLAEWGQTSDPSDAGNWTQAYSGPPAATSIPVVGVQPGATYYIAVSYIRGQNTSARQVYGPYTAPGLTAGDVLQNSPAMLEVFYQQVDAVLASTLRIIDEQERRVTATTDTQRFIDRIGRVDPATGEVDLRDTAARLLIGRTNMQDAVGRVDEGLDGGGFIRQNIPRSVAFGSNAHNEQVEIFEDGRLIRNGMFGGGQVIRVAEATSALGFEAVIKRGAGLEGGRLFFQKPLSGTTFTGDLCVSFYGDLLRFFDATTLKGVSLNMSLLAPAIGSKILATDANGRIGIGTTAPDGALHVTAMGPGGTAQFTGTTWSSHFNLQGGESTYIRGGKTTSEVHIADVNSGNVSLAAGGGFVGIGFTAAPAVKLHVNGPIRSGFGSIGFVQLEPGDATNTGRLELRAADGTRYSYIGLVNTTAKIIDFRAENGAAFQFTGGLLTVANGLTVTGDATFAARPTFNGNIPWDSQNLPAPFSASSLTSGTLPLARYGQDVYPVNGTPRDNLGNPSLREQMFPAQFNNKVAFADPSLVTIESTTDGVTWTTVPATDDQKRALMAPTGGINAGNINIPYNSCTKFRITINWSSAFGYCFLNAAYMWWSTSGNATQVHAYQQQFNGTWVQHTSSPATVSNWPGHLYLPFETLTFNNADGYVKGFRLEFTPVWNATYLQPFSLYNLEVWGGYPSGKRTIYTWDNQKNVTFPANLNISKDQNATTELFISNYDTTNSSSRGQIKFQGGNVQGRILAVNGDQFYLGSTSNHGFSLQTNSTNALSIDTSQRVGIGVTPTQKLDVAGAIRLAGSLIRTGADQTFAVDTGFGFHWAVNAVDVALLEANGRLSLNAITLGGVPFDPAQKANLASPTFTGTVGGITKAMVGLGSADDTADTAKPVSTAQQTALDLKAPIASPTFTGTTTIGGSLTRVGADHNLNVDAGFGFRFKVANVDQFLFEASGRLSLNAINMGGFGLGEWADWTPTPTAEAGAATGLAVVYAERTRHGKTVTISFAVSQTAINTASGAIIVPLPWAAKTARNYFGSGKNFNNGNVLLIDANGANLRITAANAYPMGAGAESFSGTITYQAA